MNFLDRNEFNFEPSDKVVEAIESDKYPAAGVQFHPESILTPDGKRMLENFLKL